MGPKWVIFLVSVYLLGSVFGGLVEGTYLESEETSLLEEVVGIETYHIMGISIPKPSLDWLSSLGKMMLWEFAMFKNPDGSPNEWALLKWVVFLPISLGMMYVIITTFIPMLISGIRAVKFW